METIMRDGFVTNTDNLITSKRIEGISKLLIQIFNHMVEDDLVTEHTITNWLEAHEVRFIYQDAQIISVLDELDAPKPESEPFDIEKELNIIQGEFIVYNTEDVPQRELLIQDINLRRRKLERITGKVITVDDNGLLALVDPTDEEDS